MPVSSAKKQNSKREMKMFKGAGVILRGWPTQPPHRLTKYLSTTEHEEWQVVDTMHLSTQSFDF